MLGIHFHEKLLLHDAVDTCVTAALWKTRSILRLTRYYTDAELLRSHKTNVLR